MSKTYSTPSAKVIEMTNSEVDSIVKPGAKILVDTSTIITRHGNPSSTEALAIQDFEVKCITTGTDLFYCSKTEEELVISSSGKKLAKKKDVRKAELARNPSAMKSVVESIEELVHRVEENPALQYLETTPNKEFMRLCKDIMSTQNLEYGDAAILASAKLAGIQNILTSDTDYTRISDPYFTIITCKS